MGQVTENEGTPLDVKHYRFMSGVINEILAIEKEFITIEKTKLNNFSCPSLFDDRAHIKFMIERYLYFSALLQYHKLEFDLSEMNKYVISISIDEYKQSSLDTQRFFNDRIELYCLELEMLKELKHPHPGKIVWCLYNPSNKEVSSDTNSMFESNFVAGLQLLGLINEAFKDRYLSYISQPQTISNSDIDSGEALSLYKKGVALLKVGEYEEALDLFFKAKSINKDIEGLTAHILISRFWSSEFEIEYEYETLFDSFSTEIKNNPKIIDLFESRAWLCYHIIHSVEDLEKSKYAFYKTQSESDFSVCISIDPKNMMYYGGRSLLFSSTKEFSKALQDINIAIDLAPDNSRSYKERADIYKGLGRLKDSLRDIETAISLSKEEVSGRHYKRIKESLVVAIRESLFKKEIKSQYESITFSTNLQPGQIVLTYQRDPTQNHDVTAHQITKVDNKVVTAQRMAVNGVPLKVEQRIVSIFKVEDLVQNRSSLLIDEANDKDDWPKTLSEAIKMLLEMYTDTELSDISQMSWSKFQMDFVFSGLDQWVRNYFGLWRGNYDLLLDSMIDKVDPDNTSIYILYHFWEYVADNFNPNISKS